MAAKDYDAAVAALGDNGVDVLLARGGTLTQADLDAIRRTIFETVPISFMDTQKIVVENKKLIAERDRLRGWVAMLVDKVKEDTGIFGALTEADVSAHKVTNGL